MGKLYKTRIVPISVQMSMIQGQEYNLDFGIYLPSSLPTAPMSTGSQKVFVDSWGGQPHLLLGLLGSNRRKGKKKS